MKLPGCEHALSLKEREEFPELSSELGGGCVFCLLIPTEGELPPQGIDLECISQL